MYVNQLQIHTITIKSYSDGRYPLWTICPVAAVGYSRVLKSFYFFRSPCLSVSYLQLWFSCRNGRYQMYSDVRKIFIRHSNQYAVHFPVIECCWQSQEENWLRQWPLIVLTDSHTTTKLVWNQIFLVFWTKGLLPYTLHLPRDKVHCFMSDHILQVLSAVTNSSNSTR